MVAIRLKAPDLLSPPSDKYPAKAHVSRVAQQLREQVSRNGEPHNEYIFLQGQANRMIEDCDQSMPFRQRRNFYYLSGCNLPDSSLLVNLHDLSLKLFIPPIDDAEVIWSGLPVTCEQALQRYDIDSCLTTSELQGTLSSLRGTLHTLKDQVPVERHSLTFDDSKLRLAIEACRVVKDAHEISLIRHANAITSHAHANVMRTVKSAANESELMGAFIGTCIANGGREQAYDCICAGGSNAATLHYVGNDLSLSKKLNLLIDAGCEYNCYCSDVTRTYPINGTFSPESRQIYDIVDKMQTECMSMLRAGVKWEDVHVRAHKVAIVGLLHLGILRGTEQDLLASGVSTRFLPHGLGHYLGMDTHDVGGKPDYNDSNPMFRYLRIRGSIPAGAVVTNEPGIYFCRFLIEPALSDETLARYIDEKVLERYWDVGGVRIEDDVLITLDGCENLTTAPRHWDDVEALIHSRD